MDDLLADIDAVVAVHLADLLQADNKRTMYAHKLLCGQHILNGFHREMGNERTPFTFEVEHHVVLHPADVDDVADGNLTVFAVDFEEDCSRKEEGGRRKEITFFLRFCRKSILVPPSSFLRPFDSKRPSAKRLVPRREPVLRFINRGDELIIADGLQEEVEGLDLVTLEGIFLKGGGEDDTCL